MTQGSMAQGPGRQPPLHKGLAGADSDSGGADVQGCGAVGSGASAASGEGAWEKWVKQGADPGNVLQRGGSRHWRRLWRR